MYKEPFFNNPPTPRREKTGLYHKNSNSNQRSSRRAFYPSDSFSPNRLQKTAHNVDFVLPYSQNRPGATKVYSDNDDLVRYLKQFEEMDTIHFNSLPVLNTNSNSTETPGQDFDSYKYLSQTFPKESYYQTCYMSKDEFSIEEEQDVLSPSYLHYNFGFPTNYSSNVGGSLSSPKTSSFSDFATLQPPKRKYNNDNRCVIDSVKKTNARKVSIDTCSALSSETDSDFTFYPCSKQYYGNCLGLESVYNPNNICELPSQLEDPDSPCPPFRHGFVENSLEDFSRQFYLEDDALSDDVFVDDYSYFGGEDSSGYIDDSFQCLQTQRHCPLYTNIQSRLENMTITDRPKTSTPNINRTNRCFANESSSCSVALKTREERLQSLTFVLSDDNNQERETTTSTKRNGVIKLDVQINNTAPTRTDPELKKTSESEIEDIDLSEYNINLANAFDSLRKNSMQTKSRKLWKERRTRMRRSTLFNFQTSTTVISESTDGNEVAHNKDRILSNSGSLPIAHTTYKSSQDGHSTTLRNSSKPLRGILKNKNSVSPLATLNLSTNHCPAEFGYGLYEYNDNDISSDQDTLTSTKRHEDRILQHSFMKDPDMRTPDKSRNKNNFGNHYSSYSLDSRTKCNRKKLPKSSRVLSSPPPDRRLKTTKDDFSYSPTYVSVGVQVNILDRF